MKKPFFIFLLLFLLLTGISAAEETFKVSYTITPFESKTGGLLKSVVKEITMQPGQSVSIDLGAFPLTMTMEKTDEQISFEFDHAMELLTGRIIAEVIKVTMEENTDVHLRTPTMGAGAWLEVSWGPDTIPLVYQDFIRSISSIYEGKENARYGVYEDYSVMFNVQSGLEKDEKTLGYTTMDLDNDGTEELLFGDMHSDSIGTPLYDLYTIVHGELVHVFDGWDRSRYYLTDDGGFIHQGSNSAFFYFTAFHVYTKGRLQLLRSLIHDSEKNSSDPWFMSYISEMDAATGLPIIEYDAKSIMEHCKGKQIDLTPFP